MHNALACLEFFGKYCACALLTGTASAAWKLRRRKNRSTAQQVDLTAYRIPPQ